LLKIIKKTNLDHHQIHQSHWPAKKKLKKKFRLTHNPIRLNIENNNMFLPFPLLKFIKDTGENGVSHFFLFKKKLWIALPATIFHFNK